MLRALLECMIYTFIEKMHTSIDVLSTTELQMFVDSMYVCVCVCVRVRVS